jgi:hypothetical protein
VGGKAGHGMLPSSISRISSTGSTEPGQMGITSLPQPRATGDCGQESTHNATVSTERTAH